MQLYDIIDSAVDYKGIAIYAMLADLFCSLAGRYS